MIYTCKYKSPLGEILLAADEIGLTGLWFEGQKYFANTLPDERISQETEILSEAKKWLDIYFSGEKPTFTPPLHPAGSTFRQAVINVAADLLPQLMERRESFLAFARSRKNVEILVKETRDHLDAAGFLGTAKKEEISGYRGGYTPLERKSIEQRMISGDLLGLVSTNALELGIDIGKISTTVLAGYPGTRASFWQQTGRAGRGSGKCTNYLILANLPISCVGGGIYPNMLCAHPPFQIDGNFGFAVAVAEMLIQSRKGHILLLPALPDEWKDGNVRGMKVQGDITVDFEWRDSRIHRVRLCSSREQKVTLECNGISKTIFLRPDGTEDMIFG